MCFLFANVFLFEEGHGENQVREAVMRSVFKTLPKTKIDSAIETPKTQSKLNLEKASAASRCDRLAKKHDFCVFIFLLKTHGRTELELETKN